MSEENIGMYPDTKTWNPFVGCLYDCVYCEKSFKAQAKRRKKYCTPCYEYVPHYHLNRLSTIPSKPIVFVCGMGDIRFCDPEYTREIIKRIKAHKPRIEKTFYFQSKDPAYFEQFLGEFPDNAVLLTTLETNRDEGYRLISKAPLPSKRFRDFYNLDYPKKVLTIEPVIDFDHSLFVDMINMLHSQGSLEYVWFGYDSKNSGLIDPSRLKSQWFVDRLKELGITVRGKKLKGVTLE